jgi:alkaline phosphatase D
MKVAIASCCKLQQINPQPVWDDIRHAAPDVLLLGGDNVYLENDHHQHPELLAKELTRLYDKQLAEPHFRALLDDMKLRNGRVLAMYDDHDFLGNNRYGGENDPDLCRTARDIFAHAFGQPQDAEGNVYQYIQDPAGLLDLFLLDQRFYRTSPHSSGGDRDAVLGVRQWEWFEGVFQKSTAKYRLVASSSTFHSYAFSDENWEQYPAAFERMRELFRQQHPGALLVSGDIHRNEMYDDSGVLEIVTSAVARKGIVFGGQRQNYGILTFDAAKGMHVKLHGLKANTRFDVTIPLTRWEL